ncbi:MAG TPA: hypothetical protein V6C81_28305 [Planktothrix sp.]|jgi:hypothetical protein
MRQLFTSRLKPLLVSAVACVALAYPCRANETITYTCTPTGDTDDAVSTYETSGGASVVHLGTVADGNSCAGVELAAIPYPPAAFSDLLFAMQGDPNSQHGPYLIMTGTYKKNVAGTIVLNIGKTKSQSNVGNGYIKYRIERDDLGLSLKSFFPTRIYIQSYPGAKGSSSYNFYGFYYNGNGFTYSYGAQSGCPVGSTVP